MDTDRLRRKKIIIIGGGVAGLSTGIYGQLNGFDTHILEMHALPGGQCTAWGSEGYRFDYCLHWLVGTRRGTFHNIWKETGVLTDKVQIADHDIHTLIEDETQGKFYIFANIDRWQEYLLRLAPEDRKGISKMCGHMKKGIRLDQFENAPGCRSLTDYLKAVFSMGGTLLLMMRYGKMSAKEYIESLGFKSLKLRYFLMKMFGEADFSALAIILMLGWFHDKNAGYLVGGSLPIAMRMAHRYKELGGVLSLQKKVEKILVENGQAVGVRMKDGTEERADFVISAADGHFTLYEMLEGKYLTPAFKEAYGSWKLFSPFVQVSFGIQGTVPSENVVVMYVGKQFRIGNFDVKDGYYIMNQTAHDPTLAPEGKSSVILRFNSAWDEWQNIPTERYKQEKERIREDAVLLLEKHYPGIKAKIEVTDVSTPLTEERYTGVWRGAYEGFMPTGNIMTKSLPHSLPGLSNFHMVGQWLFPGGGLPPAAQSGKWIIQTLCKKDRRTFKTA